MYIYVTPSLYDYGTELARIVPNPFHPKIIAAVEGRAEEDDFPTVYASNTLKTVHEQATKAGLILREGRYLGQYPPCFMFNRVLFWLGSLCQTTIEKYELTRPLQGWMYCVVQQPESRDKKA
ncbi:MAG: hypothetical protein AAGL10_06890 [Pseudomonadota bacterium]